MNTKLKQVLTVWVAFQLITIYVYLLYLWLKF